jgi:hypothetical protein
MEEISTAYHKDKWRICHQHIIEGIYKLLSGQASFGKTYYCAAFLKQMPNFNLLLTVTSDINGVLFSLFNTVFVPYIRFITVNNHQKSAFFNTNCKYVRF